VGATKLITHRVEKVWGRRDLPEMFGSPGPDEEPIGEIWFQHPGGEEPELLVKYLFTSERLSIQVHPDDEAAQAVGYPRGKDEAWVVVAADPDGEIGIGLREDMTREELRAAALDGSIEDKMDWRRGKVGDVYYSQAGTVHALGPGLGVIEVQQNVDLTYRLYDYGRPRALHLDEGVAVSNPGPFHHLMEPYDKAEGRRILADARAFVLERWTGPKSGTLMSEGPTWLIPVSGRGSVNGEALDAGDVWIVEGTAPLSIEAGADLLVAYKGELREEALV
jgi:mannose-6-phosphate isomerase